MKQSAQAPETMAAQSRFTPETPGSSQVTDEVLAQACRSVLRELGETIQVSVQQGWVALRGEVSHGRDRWRAEEKVGHVAGALGVSAQLKVRLHKV